MKKNLISQWPDVDSGELRIVLREHYGGHGQYESLSDETILLSLPLAGETCRLKLTFVEGLVTAIEPGPAFDPLEWDDISAVIERSLLGGHPQIGRFYAFSRFRVRGSWRGEKSGIQILPPLKTAPDAKVEGADHPFILEYPVKSTDRESISRHRRQRDLHTTVHLLNVALTGGITHQPFQPEHFWAHIPTPKRWTRYKWVENTYFAPIDAYEANELSPPARRKIKQLDPATYYRELGHDGRVLRVPSDLDDTLRAYSKLSRENRARFDRAIYWWSLATQQWSLSVSASYASLAIAIEALCGTESHYEKTKRFKAFLELYAPGLANEARRGEMYSVRSEILHGKMLLQLDADIQAHANPTQWHERALLDELWRMTGIALRGWLTDPAQHMRQVNP